jgi:excisionase family DNA binding protein
MTYLRPAEAARRYGRSPRTLAGWADAGLIEVQRPRGGHRRYNEESLERFLRGEELDREQIRAKLRGVGK